ncbi:hypothetical protein Cgig2_028588 [Carnegiea gigantea]|uniref:Uncharacterized protein n=1 Tax=Carnegiea gigantea TaxID=171969 RepID=A0A9Q1K779_9CARY|nr:hypothetical protein Cgig2_028588 [Carnegiea gigantea]
MGENMNTSGCSNQSNITRRLNFDQREQLKCIQGVSKGDRLTSTPSPLSRELMCSKLYVVPASAATIVALLLRILMDVDSPLNDAKLKKKLFRESDISVELIIKSGSIYVEVHMEQRKCLCTHYRTSYYNVEEQGEDHESENHIEDRLGKEDYLHTYNFQDNPYFQSILADEDQFFTDFVEYVSNGNDDKTKASNEDVPKMASQAKTDKNVSRRAQKYVLKTNTVQLKRNRRQSGGSAMLSAQIKHMVASYRIMSQAGPNRMNKQASSMSTIAMAIQIINRMVDNQILEKGSDFWCYANHVLEDAVKREIFLNIDDDDSRLKWLQYLHRMKDN